MEKLKVLRNNFIVGSCSFSLAGGTKYLSQTILEILLSLLKKEVPENGRHLQQYFHVFLAYAMKGSREVRVE